MKNELIEYLIVDESDYKSGSNWGFFYGAESTLAKAKAKRSQLNKESKKNNFIVVKQVRTVLSD